MFIIAIGALTNDAAYYGPYGDAEVAERARVELQRQGHDGQVRPLTNGLLAYEDMRQAPPDPFNDWTPRG